MASGDEISPNEPINMTYSKCPYPFIGALFDYLDNSMEYIRRKTFVQAERLNAKVFCTALSSTFMASVCLILGFVSNVKLEAVTQEALPVDLHFMLMSKENNFYVDDIDASKVTWCIEASDCVGLIISCALIWYSSNVVMLLFWGGSPWKFSGLTAVTPHSPLSEYLYLPWLGVTLRGLVLRQAPTVGALVYTMAVAVGTANPLFITAFLFLFMLEGRLWLEVVRLLAARWRRRVYAIPPAQFEVETLWSNEDGQSVEVRSFAY